MKSTMLAAAPVVAVVLAAGIATPAMADKQTPTDQRAWCVGYAGLVGTSALRFISAYDNGDTEKMQEEVDKVGAYVWILSLKPGCLAENAASQMILELLTRLNR